MSESSPLTAVQEHSLETRNHSHFLLKCTAESFELFQAGKQQEAALAFMFYCLFCGILGISTLPVSFKDSVAFVSRLHFEKHPGSDEAQVDN